MAHPLRSSSIANDERRQRADAAHSIVHGDPDQSNERAVCGRYLYRLPTQWVDYDAQRKQLKQTPRLPPAGLCNALLPRNA